MGRAVCPLTYHSQAQSDSIFNCGWCAFIDIHGAGDGKESMSHLMARSAAMRDVDQPQLHAQQTLFSCNLFDHSTSLQLGQADS